MLQLTGEQKAFLIHHGVSPDDVFDATGIKTKDYKIMMKQLEKHVAIGVTPCKEVGHTMRSSAGRCLGCNHQDFQFIRAHYMNAFIYVAASPVKKVIKVGCTKDVKDRGKTLNANTAKYGGSNDWIIIYYAKCNNAGKVESEIHSRLSDYSTSGEYVKSGKVVACYELFSCGYKMVKEVIERIKADTKYNFTNEYETENAVELFNFENLQTKTSNRLGNTNNRSDVATSVKQTYETIISVPVDEPLKSQKEKNKELKNKLENTGTKTVGTENPREIEKSIKDSNDEENNITSIVNKIILVFIILLILFVVFR